MNLLTSRIWAAALLLSSSANAAPAPLSHPFPSGFKWCVSTAAHQIEGYNSNSDWWDFEKLPGKIKRGETSGAACDHWNRLAEDTALIKQLGVKQYRFSIEWAKIEPSPGKWDLTAVQHYRQELALLEANGIEPMITLHHFTMPRWLRAQGGWEWAGAPEAFARYTRFVYTQIAPEVRDWITINEPMVHLLGGYYVGLTPPGIKDMKRIVAPLRGLIRSHAAAYHALHEEASRIHRDVRVGIAHHLRVIEPDSPFNPFLHMIASAMDWAANWSFGEACESGHLVISIPTMIDIDEMIPEAAHTQDFIGVNYYSRDMVSFTVGSPLTIELIVHEGSPVNDLGWEIYPQGFYRVLKGAQEHFPGKPILVTENGVADVRDAQRPEFIRSHLSALHRAMSEGVPVEGYCHWSLMDNFEWIEGFAPRFGLYAVDYATQKRTPRPSARIFSEITHDNGF
jgi:beta-glucosidase